MPRKKQFQTTILVTAYIDAESTQDATQLARQARDALQIAFANDCKVPKVRFLAPRIIKTLWIRKVIDKLAALRQKESKHERQD